MNPQAPKIIGYRQQPCVYCGRSDGVYPATVDRSLCWCNHCQKTYNSLPVFQPMPSQQPQMQMPSYQPQTQMPSHQPQMQMPSHQPMSQMPSHPQMQMPSHQPMSQMPSHQPLQMPSQQQYPPQTQMFPHPSAINPTSQDSKVYGFTAQGEPITNHTQTMLYRSQQLLNKQNEKYKAMKVSDKNIKFEPANQNQDNSYNEFYGDLNEAFSQGVAPQSWGAPVKPDPNVALQPEVSHNQLIKGFEQAADSMEETGQIRQQVNPLRGSFPTHLPVSQGTRNEGLNNSGMIYGPAQNELLHKSKIYGPAQNELLHKSKIYGPAQNELLHKSKIYGPSNKPPAK